MSSLIDKLKHAREPKGFPLRPTRDKAQLMVRWLGGGLSDIVRAVRW